MRGPNVNIRFNNNSPENFRREVSKVIRGGGNIIATVNDEIAIKAQNKRGVSLEDARDYSVTGCVEITSAGRIFSSSDAALFNLPFCLELALFNGRSQRTSKVETVVQLPLLQRFLFKLWLKFGRMGVKSGAPSSFNSMDDVINAFKKQVAYFVRLMVEGSNALERAHKEWLPTPLLSICLDGCLEKGIDVNEGGAKYNFTGVQAVGIADVADSLFAIDKIIFKEKRMSFKELSTLLKKNFRGEEEKRLLLWNSPKYGNDLDEVDFYAKMVAEIFDKEVSKYENPRGGMFFPGIYSIGTQVGFGKAVGASPSGRKAGEPLATGINPHQGCDQKGPTATLRSISKIDHSLFANGIAVNMEINPKTVEGDAGIDILSALIKSFFRIGGLHIHFNIIDKKTLINAQKNPARYQDLLIRVGGFSARFVALSKEHQDEIISRTEHYVQPDF
jgi:formate C-acetyltransferase